MPCILSVAGRSGQGREFTLLLESIKIPNLGVAGWTTWVLSPSAVSALLWHLERREQTLDLDLSSFLTSVHYCFVVCKMGSHCLFNML